MNDSNLWGKITGLFGNNNSDILGMLGKIGGGSIAGKISPNAASLISSGMDTIAGLAGFKPQEDTNYNTRSSIANGIMAVNPVIGLGAKAFSMANEAFGTSVNQYNKEQRNFAGINKFENAGNQIFGTIASLSPFGLLTKAKKNTIDSVMTQEFEEEGANGWAGVAKDARIAQTMGGKNYLLGTNKSNSHLEDNNKQIADATAEINKNKPVKTAAPFVANLYANQNFNRNAGGTTITAQGKNGLKLLSREELNAIYASKNNNVTKFQNGGSILIPEGALHKNKHHMEDVNPELAEDLTKKGIPVVVTDSEGNVEQVAEVEREEITLSKSLTEQIEDLWKDGSEEAMIEAGKLFVDALFNDCTDNTGLIDKVE